VRAEWFAVVNVRWAVPIPAHRFEQCCPEGNGAFAHENSKFETKAAGETGIPFINLFCPYLVTGPAVNNSLPDSKNWLVIGGFINTVAHHLYGRGYSLKVNFR